MERHVERGEGKLALALLPQVRSARADIADAGRRVALLAARQVDVPIAEELRLHRLRLEAAAPAGSGPRLGDAEQAGKPTPTVPVEEAVSRLGR
jgi:hypothetical protein